jgi:dTDP-4-dehydrorhamnose reductase
MQVFATVHEHSVDVPGVEEVTWSANSESSISSLLSRTKPAFVVYCAGVTNVDQCELNEDLANRLHAHIPAAIAENLRSRDGKFVYISTDHLWAGNQCLVAEDEPLRPINAYARSKALGEQLVGAADPMALILRTNFFGCGRPWRQSLSDWILARLKSKQPINAFADAYFSPISLPHLHGLIVDCTDMGLTGVYHACGSERVSKYQFAVELARWFQLPESGIQKGRISDARLIAPRPADMSLSTKKISIALERKMPRISESFRFAFNSA